MMMMVNEVDDIQSTRIARLKCIFHSQRTNTIFVVVHQVALLGAYACPESHRFPAPVREHDSPWLQGGVELPRESEEEGQAARRECLEGWNSDSSASRARGRVRSL